MQSQETHVVFLHANMLRHGELRLRCCDGAVHGFAKRSELSATVRTKRGFPRRARAEFKRSFLLVPPQHALSRRLLRLPLQPYAALVEVRATVLFEHACVARANRVAAPTPAAAYALNRHRCGAVNPKELREAETVDEDVLPPFDTAHHFLDCSGVATFEVMNAIVKILEVVAHSLHRRDVTLALNKHAVVVEHERELGAPPVPKDTLRAPQLGVGAQRQVQHVAMGAVDAIEIAQRGEVEAAAAHAIRPLQRLRAPRELRQRRGFGSEARFERNAAHVAARNALHPGRHAALRDDDVLEPEARLCYGGRKLARSEHERVRRAALRARRQPLAPNIAVRAAPLAAPLNERLHLVRVDEGDRVALFAREIRRQVPPRRQRPPAEAQRLDRAARRVGLLCLAREH